MQTLSTTVRSNHEGDIQVQPTQASAPAGRLRYPPWLRWVFQYLHDGTDTRSGRRDRVRARRTDEGGETVYDATPGASLYFGIIVNIANIITIIRTCMVPVSLYLFWQDSLGLRWVWFATFIAATTLDYADGFLARRFYKTALGEYIDHFMDKVVMRWIVVAVVAFHLLPLWIGAIIVFRGGWTNFLRLITAKDEVKLKVALPGKVNANTEPGLIGIAILFLTFHPHLGWFLLGLFYLLFVIFSLFKRYLYRDINRSTVLLLFVGLAAPLVIYLIYPSRLYWVFASALWFSVSTATQYTWINRRSLSRWMRAGIAPVAYQAIRMVLVAVGFVLLSRTSWLAAGLLLSIETALLFEEILFLEWGDVSWRAHRGIGGLEWLTLIGQMALTAAALWLPGDARLFVWLLVAWSLLGAISLTAVSTYLYKTAGRHPGQGLARE